MLAHSLLHPCLLFRPPGGGKGKSKGASTIMHMHVLLDKVCAVCMSAYCKRELVVYDTSSYLNACHMPLAS